MTWLRAESGDLINADHIILIGVVENNQDPDRASPSHCVGATIKVDAGPTGGADYVIPLAEGDQETCEAVRDALAECLSEGTFTP